MGWSEDERQGRIDEVTVDEYSDDEPPESFACVLDELLERPLPATVLGVPVEVVSVETADCREGLRARCRRDGQHWGVAIVDVAFGPDVDPELALMGRLPPLAGGRPRMIGPGPFEDLTAICTAATTDELWRWLVGNSHLRAAPNTFEALVAWRNLHKDRPQGALETAALLCTDLRWRRCTAPLIAEIEESGLLDADLLDRLAEGFLWHAHYPWPVPRAWFDDGTVVVENAGAARALPEPLYLERPIAPPLRRWAADRTARRHPHRACELLDRAQELDARAGDAVLAGLLDAADGYPAEARDALIELGISWPGAPVRLRALQLLAARDGDHAAATRTRGDPNGRIRAWGQRLTRPRPTSDSSSTAEPGGLQADAAISPSPEQPSLFG